MRVSIKGGRFGEKTIAEMRREDHLLALIEALEARGCVIVNVAGNEPVDLEVHVEAQKMSRKATVSTLCIQLENKYIWPSNSNARLSKYDFLATWDRSRLGPHVTHIFPPVAIRPPRTRSFEDRPALASMVATNRAANTLSPLELYSERVRIIRYFEATKDASFELWGRGWNLPPQPPGLAFSAGYKFLRKLPLDIARLRNLQGPCRDKDDAIERSVFNFCFENARGLTGYVTEKIFDSLIAGSVPIYLGCDDIEEYLPADCFVNYAGFDNLDSLVQYMKSFTREQYDVFDRARIAFFDSDEFSRHSLKSFAENSANAVVSALNKTGAAVAPP